MNLQPNKLQNDFVYLLPLQETDWEQLYNVAKDPLIWEQHPSRNRYEKEVFQNFFEGAIASKGAFIIFDISTNEPIGSSRYTDYDADERVVQIGYTFFARTHWGGMYNPATKQLMLNHAFQFVDKVHFYIGAKNTRSQIAIEKLGAKKIAEQNIAYYGEKDNLNYQYEIKKNDWLR